MLFAGIFWSLTGILSSFAQECGRPPLSENRIVGGTNAQDGEWPWQVDIQNKNVHVCGGSIITTTWILSAAHCFPNPSDFSLYIIYVGRNRLNGIDQTLTSYRIRRVVVPNGYVEPNSGNDVALVQLSTPISWSEYAHPVCLPASGTLFPAGMNCYVTGWGNVRQEVPLGGIGTLQEVQVPIISQSSCQEMYNSDPSETVNIQHDMICAGYQEGGKDSCQGDSGGPLVCQMVNGTWVQAGVVSFGLGCAQRNKPGVYARLTSFSDFISNTVPEVQLYGSGPRTWCDSYILLVSCLSTWMLFQRLI